MSEPIENNLLYRFRSLNGLLGEKYQELERQSIFFAPPEVLNDPAEGFRQVYFDGDSVLWSNLFKHYLACLVNSFYDYLSFGEDESLEDLTYTVSPEDMIPEECKFFWADLKVDFLENENIQSLIKNIVEIPSGLSQTEASYFFSLIHPFALKCISSQFRKNRITSFDYQVFNEFELSKVLNPDYFDSLKGLTGVERDKIVDLMLLQYQIQAQQVPMIIEYEKNKQEPNKRFLLTFFPFTYVKNLQKLMYPNWFTACFMTRATNSSVWGNYGQNHSGACLIFNVENESDGKYSLKLNEAIKGNDDETVKETYSLQFNEVRYTHIQEPLNFFASIGQLPIPLINRLWMVNDAGKRSEFELIYNDEWRKQHWDDFYLAITQKSKEWEYENEHRLILNNIMGDYPKYGVTLTYDFKSLKGIIFGINTKHEDKLKVIGILEKKIRCNEHYDFKFYQAYYCRHSGEIKHTELNRLKFARSESGA